jgi:protein gp37
MGEKSSQWWDITWGVVDGCDHSGRPGCDHCWARNMAKRFWGDRPFNEIRTHPERLDNLVHIRKSRRIFVSPMGDLFHPDVPMEFIAAVWSRMIYADQHNYIIPTKRIERAIEIIPQLFREWPTNKVTILPNVWLGVSISTQKDADEMIPALLKTPAAKRFISIEPMLGPIDLKHIKGEYTIFDALGKSRFDYGSDGYGVAAPMIPGIDWVIVGGETGVQARPLDIRWVETIRNQCIIDNIPFFFKSWGEWWPKEHVDYLGRTSSLPDISICKGINPEGFYRIGSKNSGRLLDGQEWSQFPT